MIQLQNITKSYGEQLLFKDLDFLVPPQAKVGLIGRNGSGKSTLFKIILGEEHCDDGKIVIPKGYKIGALKQHLNFTQPTITQEVALSLKGDDKFSIYKVEKVLFGLGFTQDDLEKSPQDFSGGYQIRLNLAKLIIDEPNLLLLDEPTNYLDIVSLRWLRSFLKSYDGEVILITHDRDFMDSVTTHTIGLNRKQLVSVKGDSQKFYQKIQNDDMLYEKQKISQEKKVKELEEFIAKNKARASTAAQAQSKVKQLEKLEILDDLGFEKELQFDFTYKQTATKVLLDVKDLSFGYEKDKPLFEDISFTLKKGEVLGIIGKNGKGKSTLLNTIAKELKATKGEINYHTSSAYGHFGQTNISHLNLNNTIMEEIYLSDPKLPESKIRQIAAAMMFSNDNAKKKISLLSGGEKSRVMLGKLIAKELNILFLDEPTNHLDSFSIDALTKAIKNFEGGVIIVTHSENLLREVCDRLIIFTEDQALYFNDNYDSFLEKIGWDEQIDEKPKTTQPKVNKKETKKQRSILINERSKKTSPLKKTIEKLENSIIKTEELLQIEQDNLIKASNEGDNSKVIELSSVVTKYENEVEQMFEQMEDAQNQLDQIELEYQQKLDEL